MSEQTAFKVSISDAIITNLLNEVKPQIADLRGRPWEEIVEAVRARAAEHAERNVTRVIDGPSQQWLLLSSLVLAAYQELQPLLGNTQEVLTILYNAMAAPYKAQLPAYLAERLKISPDAPHEAFARIAENLRTGGQERFGNAFIYVQDVQDETRSFTNVNKCFFNDFFRATGAPEVTRIFCGLDNLSADELHKPQYRVRFERPTTLAQGDDACRFQFTKVQ
jgi:hypothetical protein